MNLYEEFKAASTKGSPDPGAAAHQTPQLPPKKEDIEFSVSEHLLRELESQWDELSRMAETRREGAGWRITWIEPDSPFAKIGLQKGDLVTYVSLKSYPSSTNQEELARRIGKIFDHISH